MARRKKVPVPAPRFVVPRLHNRIARVDRPDGRIWRCLNCGAEGRFRHDLGRRPCPKWSMLTAEEIAAGLTVIDETGG